jgi:N-acetylglucosaminyldiphosphoundecaprenol N-acetyl-beta-D-mannosaminyltransferase
MKRIYLFDKVPFDTISKYALIATVAKWGKVHKKSKVFNMNTYGVVTFHKNKVYSDIISSADIIYPDGWGPVLASKIENSKLIKRINVGDIIDDLLKVIEKKRLKVFLLGCQKAVVEKTALTIRKKYPDINVVGYHSGFFNKNEEIKIVKQLNDLKPNIVFVGMGLPYQEYYIFNNWEKLPKAVYLGVGGVFYYISKTKSRAPGWMRDFSLEWIYRLFQEPRRLWKRYTLDNLYFLVLMIKHYIMGIQHRNKL